MERNPFLIDAFPQSVKNQFISLWFVRQALLNFFFQLTRENKDLKERCTTLEEELRICNKQLDRGNTSIQRLERDLDEVQIILILK